MTRFLPALLLTSLLACGDDDVRGASAIDAQVPLDGQVRVADARAMDATTLSADQSLGLDMVKFASGPCFGSCPTYSVSLSEEGSVKYVGRACTARPGVFTKQVDANAAKSFLRQFAATPFFTLNDTYRVRADCPDYHTDDRSTTWQAILDGRSKTLVHYLGCEGVAGLDKVDALEQPLLDTAQVQPWIRSADGSTTCNGSDRLLPGLTDGALLKAGPQPLGFLTVINPEPGMWKLWDCNHVQLATGHWRFEHKRSILMNDDDTPLPLGADGGYGSIVFAWDEDGLMTIKGLQSDRDVDLTMDGATSCN